ncbi:MAG TPA: tRNA pseudouridine(55) synthase TruB [Armatimonadota bacterium]|jgi:tRNA pseudouridine55 synthase
MEGILAVVKPPGMTSHDVVGFVRRLAGGAKTGHTGTLDPAAAGLLLVCVGRATRLAQYLVGCDKSYWAEITFGIATDSADIEGELLERQPTTGVSEASLRAALPALTGELSLAPPRLSAIKSAGKPLHRRARRGPIEEPAARAMRVDRWELLEFLPGPEPVARLQLDCGSGTYVRSLAEALAAALGTVGHLSFLARTRVGNFRLEQAHTLEEIEQGAADDWAELLISPGQALGHLPALALDEREVDLLQHGVVLPLTEDRLSAPAGEALQLLDSRQQLIGVGEWRAEDEGPRLRSLTILVTE